MMTYSFGRLYRFAAVTIAVLFLASVKQTDAAPVVWTNTATTTWTNSTAWNPNGVPVVTSDYLVRTAVEARCPDLDGAITFGGGSLTLSNGAVLNLYVSYNGGGTTQNRVITNLVVTGSTLRSQTSNGTYTHALPLPVNFLGSSVINLANAGYGIGMNLNGGVTGSGSLSVTRNNAGSTAALLLASNNAAYSGNWTITGQSASRTLAWTVNATANSGWGSGNVSLGNYAALTLQANAYAPTATVSMTASTATLALSASKTNIIGSLQSSVGGSITLNSGALLSVGTNDFTSSFNGTIDGAGAMDKLGTNLLVLSGANTFSGGLTIRGGTVRAGVAGAIPNGAVTLSNVSGTTLDLNGYNQTVTSLTGGGLAGGNVTLGSGTLTVSGSGNMVYDGTISGGGGFVLSGAGSMTLGGASTYTGATDIQIGRLTLGASGLVSSSAVISVTGASAVFDVSATPYTLEAGQTLSGNGVVTGDVYSAAGGNIGAGGALTTGTLSFSNSLTMNAGGTNFVNLGAGATDVVIVAGGFEPQGATIYVSGPSAPPPGVYTIVRYGGSKGSSFAATPVVSYPGSRGVGIANVIETNAGLVQLEVTNSAALLQWGGLVDGNWDGATSNWINLADTSQTTFYDYDSVLFDEAGAVQNIVTLSGTLRPSALVVSNLTDYFFTGAGSLVDPPGGAVQLIKNGSGALVISNINSISGGVQLNDGQLLAITNAALGTGPLTLNGGSLALAGSFILSNAMVAGGGSLDDRGNQVTLAGPLSGGTLNKTGLGEVAIPSGNSLTGGAVISKGSLRIQNANSLGAGTVTLGDANTGSDPVSLYLGANRTMCSNPVVISASGAGTATLGSRGTITGTGNNNLFADVTINRDVVFDSNAADRTDYLNIKGSGNVTVTGTNRTIFLSVSTFTGNVTVATTGSAGYLQIGTVSGSQNYIPDTASVTVQSGSRLALSIAAESIDGLNGGGLVDLNSANCVLTVGASGGSGSFSGTLANNGANTLSLTKAGSGTQTLSGVNSNTGPTTINAGSLALSGTALLDKTTQIFVNTGATFDVSARAGYTLASGQLLNGYGTVSGAVAAASGSRITGGALGTPGTLTFAGNLASAAGATNYFDLAASTAAGGGTNDLVVVGGDLSPNGGTLYVNLVSTGAKLQGGNSYRLFEYAGNYDASTFTLVTPPARYGLSLDYSVTNQILLAVSGSNATLRWSSPSNGNWDVMTTANWQDTAGLTNDVFYQSDDIVLDDVVQPIGTTITIPTNVAVMPNSLLFNATNAFVISGPGRLSGVMTVVKTNSGALTLSSANDYSGGTVILAGRVRADNVNAYGTGTIDIRTGGQVYLVPVGTYTNSISLAGPGWTEGAGTLGAIRVEGNGTTLSGPISLAAANTNRIATYGKAAGNLTWVYTLSGLIGGGGALELQAYNNGTNSVTLSNTNNVFSGGLVIGPRVRANVGFTAGTIGTGPITVQSAGQLFIGANFSNDLVLAGVGMAENAGTLGALRLQNNGVFGNVSLAANTRITAYGATGAVFGAIGGPYNLELSSGAIALSGTNTYSGGLLISAGTATLLGDQTGATGGLSIGPNASAAAVLNIAPGAVVYVATGKTVRIGNTGSSGTSTISNVVNGVVTNDGTLYVGRPGVLLVNTGGAWTQTGDMSINGQGGYSSFAGVVPGASFVYGGTNTIKLEPASANAGSAILTIGGTFTTGRGFERTVTPSTGSGQLTITGGVLRLSASIPDLTVNASALPLVFTLGAGGGTLDTAGFDASISGVVNGAGALTKDGAGVLTLAGTNTYTGGTTISNGTLRANGVVPLGAVTVAASGTLGGAGLVRGAVICAGAIAPGSAGAGQLTVSNNATLSASSALSIELGGTNAVTGYDVLAVASNAAIGGTLRATLINAHVPVAGNAYTVMTASAISGSFASNDLPVVSGIAWSVTNTGSAIVLSVVSNGVPPALTGYDAFSNQFALAGGPLGDANGDGWQNLAAYALGFDPTGAAHSGLSGGIVSGKLSLTFDVLDSRSDITYWAETSDTLMTNDSGWSWIWTNKPIQTLAGPNATVLGTSGETNTVRVSDTAAGTNRFLRLRITRP